MLPILPPDVNKYVVTSMADNLASKIWVVASNLFYIPVIVLSIRLNRFEEAIIASFMTLVSIAYHLSLAIGWPVWQLLQKLDHFTANNAFLIVTLFITGSAHHNARFRGIVIYSWVIIEGICIIVDPLGSMPTLMGFCMMIFFIVIRFTLFWHPSEEPLPLRSLRRVSLAFLIPGIITGLVGIFFYDADAIFGCCYNSFHGLWHALGGIALSLMIVGLDYYGITNLEPDHLAPELTYDAAVYVSYLWMINGHVIMDGEERVAACSSL